MSMNQGSDVLLAGRARAMTPSAAQVWRGTLAIWPEYGAGNPRFFASGQFTSLVNCGELVNPLNSLGELDFPT